MTSPTTGKPVFPAGRGTYALVFRLERPQRLRPRKLGTVELPPGRYVYFGSALGGLAPRIERHLRRRKKRHWHIDALTGASRPAEVWWTASPERLECDWARSALALPAAMAPVPGFG